MILPEDTPASPTKTQQARELPPVDEQYRAPPPSYPGHEQAPVPTHPYQPVPSASQPLYLPPSAELPFKGGEPAGKRFLRAFFVAILVWTLLGIVVKSILEAATIHIGHRHGLNDVDNGKQRCEECHSAWPLPQDGKRRQCLHSPANWTHEDGLVHTSFDLPLDSNVFYVFSRGVQSIGNIVITQDERIHSTDMVHVDVAAIHSTPDFLHAVSVCSLERRPGEVGVGIFTPLQYPIYDRLPTLDFEVTVRFPKHSDQYPLQIPAFETNLAQFDHQITDLDERILFQSLLLQTEDARIAAQSVNASNIVVKSTNGDISGHFEANSMDLSTTNGRIEVDTVLRSSERLPKANAVLRSSNSDVIATTSLISATSDHTGGYFNIESKTTNGRQSIEFLDAPVDSTLQLNVQTSNRAASVSLHPTYEGSFRTRTTKEQTVIKIREDVPDPSGRGRERIVIPSGITGTGQVMWDGRHMGSVVVRTTNGWVRLQV